MKEPPLIFPDRARSEEERVSRSVETSWKVFSGARRSAVMRGPPNFVGCDQLAQRAQAHRSDSTEMVCRRPFCGLVIPCTNLTDRLQPPNGGDPPLDGNSLE